MNKEPAICELCNETFTSKYYLAFHISTVHEGIKKHACTKCNLSYTSKNNLEIHVKTIHEGIMFNL